LTLADGWHKLARGLLYLYFISFTYKRGSAIVPELPEVQTVVDDLKRAGVVGDRIQRAAVFWPRAIAAPAAPEFCRRIAGRRVVRIDRRAKYLVLELSGGLHLLIHLRMSGRLVWAEPGADARPGPHDRVHLLLGSKRRLCFRDPRKFGRLHLLSDPSPVLGPLGPEPLEAAFDAACLARILAPRRRALKPLLLDQRVIAGLGNIYVDEALWEARLHPLQPAGSLSRRQVQALWRAIGTVLQRALSRGGTRLGEGQGNFHALQPRQENGSDALQVFRREGAPCPRCGRTLVRTVVCQRGTHTCPRCQALRP
jgi:formamidopyrimidine-DNA glycosylase